MSGPSFTYTSTGLTVAFTDTSTSDNPPISAWAWDFGDGTTSSEQNPSHSYSAGGTYQVQLTVTDASGNSSTTSPITVKAANTGPTADFTLAINGQQITCTDTSEAGSSAITQWLWDFGDSLTASGADVTHIYAVAGTYTVTLTVTDSGGNSAEKIQTVVVGAEASDDTYTVRGFIGYIDLADNDPNVIAPIGELSLYSKTFAKDRQIYGAATASTNITVFDSLTSDGSTIIVPSDYTQSMLDIAAWLYSQFQASAFTADVTAFITAFTSQFGTTITGIGAGTMVQSSSKWMPSYIDFYFINPSTQYSATVTAKSHFKLWLADQAFENQYPGFTFSFIPPITKLDDFFSTAATVKAELSAMTMPQTMAAINTARGSSPETLLNTLQFNWIDPNDTTDAVLTDWTFLLWGQAGNDLDSIKTALQNYILANSTHTRDEWATIFPDIFQSTEFILTPLFNQYAIPNLSIGSGIYQPTVNVSQALNVAAQTSIGVGYTSQFVANVLNVVPVPYASLSFLAVGGPQNSGGINEFAKRWPDYLNVTTTSTDFMRMSDDTQAFVLFLIGMLKVAESMTDTSDLPTGMTRVSRTAPNGTVVDYLSSSYNSIQYLVVTKAWMINQYGQSTNQTETLSISYTGTYLNGAYQIQSANNTMQLQFEALNGNAPLAWEITDTTINSPSITPTTGLFQGTFPSIGNYTLTLKVTDRLGRASSRTFTFAYSQPESGDGGSVAFDIARPAIMTGKVGAALSTTMQISGGTAPYSITQQSLPAGLAATISGSVVTISGTPTSAGVTTSSITVKDSATLSNTASTTWSMSISS